MKNWVLVFLFALMSLLAIGCADTTEPTEDQTVETSTVDSELTYSCAERCSEEYDACITGDPFGDCLCQNAFVMCRRGCGYPGGWAKKCWP